MYWGICADNRISIYFVCNQICCVCFNFSKAVDWISHHCYVHMIWICFLGSFVHHEAGLGNNVVLGNFIGFSQTVPKFYSVGDSNVFWIFFSVSLSKTTQFSDHNSLKEGSATIVSYFALISFITGCMASASAYYGMFVDTSGNSFLSKHFELKATRCLSPISSTTWLRPLD